MASVSVEKLECIECGADVREGTAFCYNCGGKLTPVAGEVAEVSVEAQDEGKAAIDDLAARLAEDETKSEKLVKAAAERRKARSVVRKPKEFVWEPVEDSSRSMVVIAIGIFVISSVIVFYMVVLK